MIMAKLEEINGYNDHYGTRNHKFTFNIPNPLLSSLIKKSKQAGYMEVAPYLRHVIANDVQYGSLSIQDILGEKINKRWEYQDRQRRDKLKEGFKEITSKNFLDKIRRLGLYFRRSSDQQFFEF